VGDSHASKHQGGQNATPEKKKKTKRIYDLVDIVVQVNSMLYKDVSVQLMSSFLGPWAPSKYKSVIYNCTGCIKKG
jgi:hypothetical protein